MNKYKILSFNQDKIISYIKEVNYSYNIKDFILNTIFDYEKKREITWW